MIENVDPNTIEDEGVRQVVITLMNLAEQAEEIRWLRDELRRLKGEQGTPIDTFSLLHPLIANMYRRCVDHV